jgi:shikimate kinase
MSQPNNIFLIGMPGVGKSTVGRALARQLGLSFVDADEELVARNGVEIATIFEIEGEAGFRQREASVIAELAERDGIVLATGGGAILRAENRAVLAANGVVVYLRAEIDVLVDRTSRDLGKRKKRPLLEGANIRQRLTELLAIREPLYQAIAHITVDANQTSRAKFLQKLIDAITSHQHASPTQPPALN